MNNFVMLSLFGKKDELFSYVLNMFNQNQHMKEDEFYILFMIKSGNINQLIKEKKDLLYREFYSILYILLDNYEYFDEFNVNLFFESLLKSDSEYVYSLYNIEKMGCIFYT